MKSSNGRSRATSARVELAETGTVITVGDGIARIYGLDKCMAGELLLFPRDIYGMALNLEEDNVGAVLLGADTDIKEGDEVRRTGRIMEVPVGEAMIGRVVNSLGQPIDGKGPIETQDSSPIERIAPGVIDRHPVNQPLQTGLKAIDSMVPIGRGQRELIIGDRQTGKTAVAIDAMISQKAAWENEPEWKPGASGRRLHLCRYRPEALDGGPGRSGVGRARRHALFHRGGGDGQRPGTPAVRRSLRWVRHGRVFPRQGRPCAVHL